MSLINDALKRARQGQKHPAGPPVAPLQPVEDSGRPSRMLRAAVGVLVLASLTCSALFLWKYWSSSNERIVALAKETGARPAANADAPVQSTAPERAIKVTPDIVVRRFFPAPPPRESEAFVPAPASHA